MLTVQDEIRIRRLFAPDIKSGGYGRVVDRLRRELMSCEYSDAWDAMVAYIEDAIGREDAARQHV